MAAAPKKEGTVIAGVAHRMMEKTTPPPRGKTTSQKSKRFIPFGPTLVGLPAPAANYVGGEAVTPALRVGSTSLGCRPPHEPLVVAGSQIAASRGLVRSGGVSGSAPLAARTVDTPRQRPARLCSGGVGRRRTSATHGSARRGRRTARSPPSKGLPRWC